MPLGEHQTSHEAQALMGDQVPVNRYPLTLAIRDQARTVPLLGCEIARVPDPDNEDEVAPKMPYAILYPLDARFGGPPEDPHADASLIYQTTLVGEIGEQVEQATHALRTVILTSYAVLEAAARAGGLSIRNHEAVSMGGIDREGRLLNVHDRYQFDVSRYTA